MIDLCLAPVPLRVREAAGTFNIEKRLFIRLEAENPQELIPAAKKAGLPWEATASPRLPKADQGLCIRLDAGSSIPDQGYRLSIKPDGIEIVASGPAGAYYGACTLAQIVRQYPKDLPCLTISDRPDFPVRGVMLDISRDKVPTMNTLYHLVDLFSGWKINQLQLYTENTFAYHAHPTVWADVSPMTGEQVLALDAYCRSRFIELVPNQNSFGHLERWFKHEEYRSMAEAPDGCDTIWGWRDAFSLCPGDSRSIPFVRGLYDELLPHFTSRLFNVGCDETVDLGCGRSKKICEERGEGRVYLDFLLKIYGLVKEHGRTMMFWGDIITKHPELIPDLPKDILAVEWGYEAAHPFAENCARFRESGIPFYVGPGTSSWNTICGRTRNAVENIANAAENGLKQGAAGMLNTDWGDTGHWQPLSVSYLGFIAGAMAGWNAGAELDGNLAKTLSLHAFGDATGKTGRAFYDLGNLYTAFGKHLDNSSVPWHILFRSGKKPEVMDGVTLAEVQEVERRLEGILAAAEGAEMAAPDAGIVRAELRLLADTLRLAALTGRVRLGEAKPENFKALYRALKKSHRSVWLLRNRPGGLPHSLSQLPPAG